MRVQKLLLLIITAAITAILLFVGVLNYIGNLDQETPSTAIFFLGVTGAFSVYFHFKTKEIYPFAKFDGELEELSKKYWALHVSFGCTLLILGSYATVAWLKNPGEVVLIVIFIFVTLLAIWTLLDTYFLNKFIVSHKERLERRQEIENITGTIDES
ncbi:MAG: hypothetical protein AAF611_03605 [Bacteroidota bacterium]